MREKEADAPLIPFPHSYEIVTNRLLGEESVPRLAFISPAVWVLTPHIYGRDPTGARFLAY